jgi:hypothetical protein
VLALNEDRLSYFADVRFKLDDNLQTGGDYFKLGAGPSGVLDPIVMDATHAFWASEDAVQRGVLGVDYVVDFVANTEEHDAVTGLTITSTHVYIASEHGNISRSALTPTDPIVNEPLARDQISPKWLVHDDTNLYWIGTDCRIMSLALPP